MISPLEQERRCTVGTHSLNAMLFPQQLSYFTLAMKNKEVSKSRESLQKPTSPYSSYNYRDPAQISPKLFFSTLKSIAMSIKFSSEGKQMSKKGCCLCDVLVHSTSVTSALYWSVSVHVCETFQTRSSKCVNAWLKN